MRFRGGGGGFSRAVRVRAGGEQGVCSDAPVHAEQHGLRARYARASLCGAHIPGALAVHARAHRPARAQGVHLFGDCE